MMSVVADMVGMVKTNTKGFFKDSIYNLTNYLTGGSYLFWGSKPMVPGGRPLISIGYKYNARKVLSFIAK